TRCPGPRRRAPRGRPTARATARRDPAAPAARAPPSTRRAPRAHRRTPRRASRRRATRGRPPPLASFAARSSRTGEILAAVLADDLRVGRPVRRREPLDADVRADGLAVALADLREHRLEAR